MGKTFKGKAKAEAKAAKAKAKIVRKCKGTAAIAFAAILSIFAGCSTADSQQPAKSATMNNTFNDCNIIVAAKAKVPVRGATNSVIEAEGGNMPSLEVLTQTQSLESSGTESFAQANTQTPTTDIKPKTDLRYNDAIGAGGNAANSFFNSLSDAGKALLVDYITNKKSGTIEVEKSDGTKETVTCDNGKCTTSDGTVLDCDTCKDCTVQAK